tara:strand:- start:1690 stop:2577 length:888 start_codon:yes stop_codon:yes gene_type:complete
MAGVVTKGTTYANGSQITSSNLNALVDDAVFSSNAVDDGSTALNDSAIPAIIVKNAGISAVKLATDAVETAKIKDGNVTKAKIENVANLKVLGNTSGSAAAPQEVAILDEDTMSSNSATSLATQQSIKAYVDGRTSTAISTLATAHEITVSVEGTFVDLSTLTTAITTKEADSTFIVSGMINIGYKDNGSNYLFKIQYRVGSGAYQDFNLPTSAGSRLTGHFSSTQSENNDDHLEAISFMVPLVDPAYSVGDVLTFKIQGTDVTGTDNILLNRDDQDGDDNDHRRAISTLKVEEI